MKKNFLTISPAATRRVGQKLAQKILKDRIKEKAQVIGLIGDLGGGKTTFLQGFAKGLGIKEKVLSPTFIIVKKFQIPNSRSRLQNFYHIDCYRIKKPKELLNLNFKKIISDPQNIIAIEWADRIKKIMPPNTLWINFEFINNKTRKIVLK